MVAGHMSHQGKNHSEEAACHCRHHHHPTIPLSASARSPSSIRHLGVLIQDVESWAHKGPPRSTQRRPQALGKYKGGRWAEHLHSRQGASSPLPTPIRPRGRYGRFSGAQTSLWSREMGRASPTADRESTTALRGRCHPGTQLVPQHLGGGVSHPASRQGPCEAQQPHTVRLCWQTPLPP